MTVAAANAKVARALTRLERSTSMGARGRKNARAAFAAAVRALRAAVDKEYPAVRAAVQRTPLTVQQRIARLRAKGYEPLATRMVPVEFAEAHVPCVRAPATVGYPAIVWAPKWANDARRVPQVEERQLVGWLRRLRKPAERDCVRAEIAVNRARHVARLAPGLARAATARCKRDPEFAAAILAADMIGDAEVKSVVENTADLLTEERHG